MWLELQTIVYKWAQIQIKELWLWLNHWGWMTHICVSKLTIIGSDNGLSPGRRQNIIWNNTGILWVRPLETNFSEILTHVHGPHVGLMNLAIWKITFGASHNAFRRNPVIVTPRYRANTFIKTMHELMQCILVHADFLASVKYNDDENLKKLRVIFEYWMKMYKH